MLVSLKGHAGEAMGVENLQTSTPTATRDTVSVMVESHWCTTAAGIGKKGEACPFSSFQLPVPSCLLSWEILVVTELAKGKRVLGVLDPGTEGPVSSRETGLSPSTLSGADVPSLLWN